MDAGYDVVGEAGDGAAGLAMICEARPDVVLLDLRMPGMGGVEVARQLRERFPNVRVIMFSAYADLGLQSILSDLGGVGLPDQGMPLPTDRGGDRRCPRRRPEGVMSVATRILVVDDDGGLRKELRQLLEDAGYDVVAEASSGFRGSHSRGSPFPMWSSATCGCPATSEASISRPTSRGRSP